MKEFTIKMQDALADAHEHAGAAGHPQIGALHLLCALLKQPDGVVSSLLDKLKMDTDLFIEESEKLLDKLPRKQGGMSSPVAGQELNRADS